VAVCAYNVPELHMMANSTAGARRKVLVVEDDQAMGVALRDGFSYEGWEVVLARDGAEALRLARQSCPELMILDVMLPGISGFDVCKKLRSDGNNVPIIMLTARGQEIDKVVGLRLGADDYVTKPFSFMELMARVEAVLRRAGGGPAGHSSSGSYAFGDVTVDFTRHEARKGDACLDLTPRELKLLGFFIRHRGEVITRDQLLDAVWGYTSIPFTRTVDAHIARLRKKIEDTPDDPRFIVTVHRLGYKFAG
jgi:two-component system, OmpR family, alkaline phosphatase synthesis response regulator PhoP